MPAVLRLIDSMQEKFRGTWERNLQEMPEWMQALHATLRDRNTHVNIRYFIAKVVLNRRRVFDPYSTFWIVPLMEVTLYSSSFDYLTRDIVILLEEEWKVRRWVK
jgi:hypothetical protein